MTGTTAGDNGVVNRNQSTNGSVWGVHTADTDETDGGFDYFVSRTLRDGANLQALRGNAYEWRFTAAGGKALVYYDGGTPLLIDVPFELWDAGRSASASDDVRLIPLLNPITGGQREVFDLGTDHPTSGATNDPQTDWVYWNRPFDETPGQAGYDAWVAAVTANPVAQGPRGEEVMARTVLVNWNGGTAPGGPFNAAMPETGTVFRIETESVSAPVTGAPLDGAVLAASQTTLHWTEPPGTYAGRVVQIARDAAFQSLVVSDSSATGASLAVSGLAPSTTYHWRIRLNLGRDTWVTSNAASFTTGTGTSAQGEATGLPERLSLDAPYPNPARGDVHVRIGLPRVAELRVDLYDMLGRRVSRLPVASVAAGWHVVTVPTGTVAPGVYVVRVEAGSEAASHAVTVLR